MNVVEQTDQIIKDIRSGVFSPVYLLMGAEPYYPNLICNEIIRHVLPDSMKDMIRVVYGGDTDGGEIAMISRGISMFSSKNPVIVKEAQNLKHPELLTSYCEDPSPDTVLVLFFNGTSMDKRKNLYKVISKIGVVLESPEIKEYQIVPVVVEYFSKFGFSIPGEAASLLVDFVGASMSAVAAEAEKIMKSLPEGVNHVTIDDIRKNVGHSRQYNIFELTNALSYKKREKSLGIAYHIGESPGFHILQATAMLFRHFRQILQCHALEMSFPGISSAEKAKKIGINPYFMKEYEAACRNYPPEKTLQICSLLEEYDFKGKGGESGTMTQGQILTELIIKILN